MKRARNPTTVLSEWARPSGGARKLIELARLSPGLPIVLYLLARLPHLLSVPLFNDEAVYLLRAQRFPAMLSSTIRDGKLLQELGLAALAQLPGDPLIWSRLLSVGCGLGTLIALLLIGRALDRPAAGILAGTLYAGAPLVLLHDRLGLPDSLLTWAGGCVTLASVRFARAPAPSQARALVIGLLVCFAALAKLPGLFLCSIPILAVLALPDSWADARRRLALLRTPAIVVLGGLAALLFLQYGIFELHKTEGGSPGQRLGVMARYAGLFGEWLAVYMPAPLLILPLLGLALRRRIHAAAGRALVFLLACGLALPAIFLLLGTVLYPRYLAPAWPALLLASAIAATELWQMRGLARGLCAVAIVLALAWDGAFAVQIQRSPASAQLVAIDRTQYLETWTAGYNIPEIIALLERMAAEQEGIQVLNHYQPRLIHLASEIYLGGNPQVALLSLNLQSANAPDRVRQLATARPVYLLLDEEEQQAFDFSRRFPKVHLLRTFENPLGTMRFYLYEQPHSRS
jgi:hypothetical protein